MVFKNQSFYKYFCSAKKFYLFTREVNKFFVLLMENKEINQRLIWNKKANKVIKKKKILPSILMTLRWARPRDLPLSPWLRQPGKGFLLIVVSTLECLNLMPMSMYSTVIIVIGPTNNKIVDISKACSIITHLTEHIAVSIIIVPFISCE